MKTKINKIIIAAAVLFAAGLSNISAIAQESDGVMTPARANVYVQASGMYSTSSQFDYDLSDTLINLTDTAMNADQSGVGNRIHLDFRRIDSDGTMIVPNPVPERGLPTFGTSAELIKAGDLFLIFNPLTGIFPNAVSSGPWRVYRRASDMALVLATVNANPAETAGTGEFFLDANFTETTEVVHGSQGLIDAVCDTANGYELNPNDSTSCVIPANCGDNATRNSDDITMCVCNSGHEFVADSTTTCKPIVILTEDDCENTQYFDENENICKDRTAENCGNTQVFSPANGGGGFCQTPAIYLAANSTLISPTYTAASCERAGWIPSITINSGNTAAAELCGIPVVRDDSALMSAAIASGRVGAEFAPLQFNEDDPVGGCIIRESSGFADLPNCNDPQLFGVGGFPQMPEDFDVARDRLTVVFIADGNNRYFADGGEVFVRRTGGDGESDAKDLAHIGAGIFLVGAIAVFLSSGEVPDFNFTPEFGYSATESGYAANIGGRADFRKDKWHLYYLANQTNANGEFGDFRYTSGGKYTADLWTATFSESVAGETADYDLSLSANLQNEVWKISPVYRLHSEYEKGETETRNELNLQGDFRYNKWTIRPTAGFQWRSFGGFAENARFQINAVHRF